MLTRHQKQEFFQNGFLKIPRVIPQLMVDVALRAINHSVGNTERQDSEPVNHRVAQLCDELRDAPCITDLFNRTLVIPLAESLTGEGNVQPCSGAQLALRFPSAVGNEAGSPRGHLDGLSSGRNGIAKGVYHRGFTALTVIYLSDVPNVDSGNFTVWPESHRLFADLFQREEHELLANGMPKVDLPHGPIQVTGQAGDLILAHHQVVHTGGPNTSADIRYATIARLRHVDCAENGYDAYTDLWHEFPGGREAIEAA